ncbi:hypothetical protein JYU19_00130 [bacterium AH-315-J21]|nr:hypothetical protein [bacterium AH-315-J21]
MKKNEEQRCLGTLFQRVFLSGIVLSFVFGLSLVSRQGVVAQGFLDISVIAKYLPDSLQKKYPAPMLADYDALFALDSTGLPLYLNFASNRKKSVVVVVDPSRAKDSTLVWVSEPLEGQIDYFYAADINADGREEIVVSSRKLGASGWNRLYIWRWPTDNNLDSVVALAPCSDTLNPYFQALTKVEVNDTGAAPDGVSEIVVTSIVAGLASRKSTTIRTVYHWTGDEYCVKR